MERFKCEKCDQVSNCRISPDCIIYDDRHVHEQTITPEVNDKRFKEEQLPLDLWHDTINLSKGCYVNDETGEMFWDIEAVCTELEFDDSDWALSQLSPDEVEEWDNNGEKHNLIGTSALFYLILLSKRTIGMRFRRWITGSVLQKIFFGRIEVDDVWENEQVLKCIMSSLLNTD